MKKLPRFLVLAISWPWSLPLVLAVAPGPPELRQAPLNDCTAGVGQSGLASKCPTPTAERSLPAHRPAWAVTFTTCQASISGDNVTITDVSMPGPQFPVR